MSNAAPNPTTDDLAARESLLRAMRQLDAAGLNRGSAGNGSVRASAGGFWVTATGMTAAELSLDRLVWVDSTGQSHGPWQPSSEWHFHRAIYRQRPDLGAVLHSHSVHATALATLRRRLPAFHYMVAVAGGDDVPCTPYHLFGTEALSDAVAAAFVGRKACLMANHGLVAGGAHMGEALKVLVEIEALCEVYLKALAVAEPVSLSRDEMAAVIERFRYYGQPASRTDRPSP
ncbi:MAG: class II aldolase/adducin family protein [Rubrivivax sp.]|jgi:L-fuculose-phosphate aldolase|nr:class II aldolase/adducin family protein [Rubrivivax sp.]